MFTYGHTEHAVTNDIKLNDMKLMKCAHFLSQWSRFTARRL